MIHLNLVSGTTTLDYLPNFKKRVQNVRLLY